MFKMYVEQEKEVYVHTKNSEEIKQIIFDKYPSLKRYSKSFIMEREFGDHEDCGTNVGFFTDRLGNEITVMITYSKKC